MTSHKIANYLPFLIKIFWLFIYWFFHENRQVFKGRIFYFGQNQDQRLFEFEFLKIWKLVVLK